MADTEAKNVGQQPDQQPDQPPVDQEDVDAGKSSTAANIMVGSIRQMDPADQEAIKKELCPPAAGGRRRSKRRRQKKSAKKSKKGGRSRKNCGSKNRRKLSRRR